MDGLLPRVDRDSTSLGPSLPSRTRRDGEEDVACIPSEESSPDIVTLTSLGVTGAMTESRTNGGTRTASRSWIGVLATVDEQSEVFPSSCKLSSAFEDENLVSDACRANTSTIQREPQET